MKTMTYEEAIQELQSILDALQSEQIGMDTLAERSQRAAELIQYCREKLRHTEAQVEQLFQDTDR